MNQTSPLFPFNGVHSSDTNQNNNHPENPNSEDFFDYLFTNPAETGLIDSLSGDQGSNTNVNTSNHEENTIPLFPSSIGSELVRSPKRPADFESTEQKNPKRKKTSLSLQKNRDSARESRRKKKEYIQNLEKELQLLRDEISILRNTPTSNPSQTSQTGLVNSPLNNTTTNPTSAHRDIQELVSLRQKAISSLRDILTQINSSTSSSSKSSSFSSTLHQHNLSLVSLYTQAACPSISSHISALQTLLSPAPPLKFLLWASSQRDVFFQDDIPSNPPSSESPSLPPIPSFLPTSTPTSSPSSSSTNPITGTSQRTNHLWKVLTQELNLTEQQKQFILSHRTILSNFHNFILSSNQHLSTLGSSLSKSYSDLYSILNDWSNMFSPEQSSKFFCWVENNPAFNTLIETLWETTL